MELGLNTKKGTKLKHVKVYDQLYRMIQDGQFLPGSQLPSEPVLAEQLSVSRMTLRRALALLQEDHLVNNIRGKGNFICAPSGRTSAFETNVMRHPVYSCCTQEFGEVEMEFRIEPPTEAIAQSLGQKSAAVVIIDRWYRHGEAVSAYSLSFIPIEVIAQQELDLNHPTELKRFLETSAYEGRWSSSCTFSYTTTGNFTAVKYTLAPEPAFLLIQENICDREGRILVSSKHYIPAKLFELQLTEQNSQFSSGGRAD